MSRPLLLALTTATALTFASGPAAAQCAPDPVANNGTVTCSGTDTNGFTSSSVGITVTIDVGSSVSRGGTNDALRLNGAGTIVQNSGSVVGTDEGIDIRGANGQITNADGAVISGSNRGIDADGIGGLTVTNTGRIEGGDSDAIRAGANLSVTNTAGAIIRGADEGIQATSGLTLTNHGTIEADDEGIEATDNATFVNTGTIQAVDDAIQTDDNTSITNSGVVESTDNDGIDIDTGSIVNSGIIRSVNGVEDGIDFDPDAANVVSTVNNAVGGLIFGNIGINVDPLNDRSQAITNAGTIRGQSGTALFLEDGDDSLTLLGTGIVDGLADFGAGADTLNLVGIQDSLVGGGDLFDGGADADTVVFNVSTQDLLSLAFLPNLAGAFELSFVNSDASVSTVVLANFEGFTFNDRSLTLAGLQAAVPLPASLPLLLGALGLLAMARRRRG